MAEKVLIYAGTTEGRLLAQEYKRKWNSISAAPAANGRWNL